MYLGTRHSSPNEVVKATIEEFISLFDKEQSSDGFRTGHTQLASVPFRFYFYIRINQYFDKRRRIPTGGEHL